MVSVLISHIAALPAMVAAAMAYLAHLVGRDVEEGAAALQAAGRWLIFGAAIAIGWQVWGWAARPRS